MTAPAGSARRWDLARLLLGLVWLVLLSSALLLREDEVSLAELYDDVAGGRVERVELVGGLSSPRDLEAPPLLPPPPPGPSLAPPAAEPPPPPGAVGTGPEDLGTGSSAQLDVRWGRLGDRSTVRLVQVAGLEQSSGYDGREVTGEDVEARLRALDPDLEVERRPFDGSTGQLLGARLPGPMVALLLAAFLATLYVIVNGPEPWRATRWAWFWLLASPFSALAFCLLSGPVRGVPPPRSDRRLTGGWAFLLGSLLGSGTWAG